MIAFAVLATKKQQSTNSAELISQLTYRTRSIPDYRPTHSSSIAISGSYATSDSLSVDRRFSICDTVNNSNVPAN